MAYRANVKVMVLSRDDTTGKHVVLERKDMGFTVLIAEPGEAVATAKAEFDKNHGPDLAVRCCNVQSRVQVLLYCQPAAMLPRNVGARELPFTKSLPQARR